MTVRVPGKQLPGHTSVHSGSTSLSPGPHAHWRKAAKTDPPPTSSSLPALTTVQTRLLPRGTRRGGRHGDGCADPARPPVLVSLAPSEWLLTDPLSLLFSAGASFSFEVLAVSAGAAGVLEELPCEGLFSVSEFTSASASCWGAVAAGGKEERSHG